MSFRALSNAAPILLIGALAVAACERSSTIYNLKSPGARYSVRVFGRPGDSPLVGANHVYVTAYKGETTLIEDAEVHYAGFLDSGFHASFDPPTWVAENVLWFSTIRGVRTDNRDEVWVENGMTDAMQYLRIHTRDLTLAFDIPPGARIPLKVTSSRDFGYVAVHAQAGSWPPLRKEASFSLSWAKSIRDVYDVRLSNLDVTIQKRAIN